MTPTSVRASRAYSNRQLVGTAGFALAEALTDALRRAAGEALASGNKQVVAVAEALQNELRSDRSLVTANRRLATMMQEATLAEYDTSVEGRKAVPSYREGAGRFPGGLRRALSSSDFVFADRSGVLFANQTLLDVEARHWYRLNFGAGQKAGEASPEFPLRFYGHTLGQLRIGEGPSGGFQIPSAPGRVGWFNERAQFFPGKPMGGGYAVVLKNPFPTMGIEGRHFLEAGLRSLSENFEPVYTDWVNGVLDRAERTARGVGADKTIGVQLRRAGFG